MVENYIKISLDDAIDMHSEHSGCKGMNIDTSQIINKHGRMYKVTTETSVDVELIGYTKADVFLDDAKS